MIADNAVTLAKMAGLARGKIIVGDSSGDPSALSIGSANTILKSDGSDASWGNVTMDMIANDSIGADQLASNAVVNDSIATNAAIDIDKINGNSCSNSLTTLEPGDILYVGDKTSSFEIKSISFGNLEDTIFGNISGDALISNAGTLTVSSSQTNIESITNTNLKIGTATNQEYIDFTTSNEVNTKINNTERLSVTSSGINITGNLTVSGSYNLASGDIPNNEADTTGNANTATALATPRTIGGVSFDGSADIKLPGIVTHSRSVHKTLSRLDISTSFLEISSDLRIQMTLTEPNVTFTLYLPRLRPNSKVLSFNIRDYNASGTPSLISNIQPVYDVYPQEPVVIRFTLTGQTIGSTIYATPIIKANGSKAYLYRDKIYGFMEFTATEFSNAANNSSNGLLYAGDG